MKKKFQICIHAAGSLNDAIIRMLTNHAEGRINADFDLLEAHARADYANWPTIRQKYTLKRNDSEGSMDIYEGEKHTMTIYEKHHFELSETDQEIETELAHKNHDPNDLKDVF